MQDVSVGRVDIDRRRSGEWRQKADLAADEPEEGNREESRLRDDVERRATSLEENGCTGASQLGESEKAGNENGRTQGKKAKEGEGHEGDVGV